MVPGFSWNSGEASLLLPPHKQTVTGSMTSNVRVLVENSENWATPLSESELEHCYVEEHW